MCGINGIYAYHYAANPVDRRELVRTRDHQAPRGPDGAGAWFGPENRIALGHRRLAIIDPSPDGAQPMASADGKIVITFNGEIYNHPELRRILEAKGHHFRTKSDTEVLLHLYAEFGQRMVEYLRGMFAFALWDENRERLILARDPYGIKPLYYADDGWTVRFASQVKALVAGGGVSRALEPAGLVGFYLWGSVPDPFTTLLDVRALPAGSFAIVDRTGLREPIRYYSIADVIAAAARSPDDATAISVEDRRVAREAMLDSVRAHLVSDVPVGLFLSAGVDSGTLLGLMRECHTGGIKTITLSFDEFSGSADDETPLARAIAGRFGTEHIVSLVSATEFRSELPRILDAMDQPSIDGLNTWFVAKAAAAHGLKVAISGLGGDELVGGYPTFRDIPRLVRSTKWCTRIPGLGALSRRALCAPMLQSLLLSPKAAGILELGGTLAGAYLLRRGLYMPWELTAFLDEETVRLGLERLQPIEGTNKEIGDETPAGFSAVATLESTRYLRNQLLRDADWAAMAHGVEVRVPLVDVRLLERLAPICSRVGFRHGKALLAATLKTPLPTAMRTRAKTGFSMPVRQWLQPLSASGSRAASTHPGSWSRSWALTVAPA